MDFIPIRSFDNYVYAHITLAMLQDAGINCHLVNEHTITVDPFLSNALGGIRLMVHPSQVQRATELLESTERGA
jgi:hypothetical protein